MKIETKFFFENRNEEADQYLANAIKNSDKGSTFESKMKNFIHLKEDILIAHFGTFKEMGYETMLGYLQNEIVGFMAYQEHKNDNHTLDWKMFRCFVEPEHRGKGYAHSMAEDLVNYAMERSIDRVRLGGEKERREMKSLLKRLDDKGYHVNLKTQWVDLENVYLLNREFPGIMGKQKVISNNLNGKKNSQDSEINSEPDFIRSYFPGFADV